MAGRLVRGAAAAFAVFALAAAATPVEATHGFVQEVGDRSVAAANVSGYGYQLCPDSYVMTNPYFVVTLYLLGVPIGGTGEVGYETCCPEEMTETVLWFHVVVHPADSPERRCIVH